MLLLARGSVARLLASRVIELGNRALEARLGVQGIRETLSIELQARDR